MIDSLRSQNLGVPNWRNADAYPRETTSPREWAWEFLRRNLAYREYYLNKVKPLEKARKLWPDRTISDLDDKDFDKDPNKMLSRYMERVFGILFHADPFQPFGYLPPMFLQQDKVYRRMGFSRSRETVHYTFDLTLALPSQFTRAQADAEAERVRRGLETCKSDIGRLRPDKYADYLRVLDALDCEISRKQAAMEIFNKAHDPLKAFDNHRLKAVELRDGGYLAIAAHDVSSYIRHRLI